MQVKKVKLNEQGQQLPDDATDHVAVLLPDHGLIFSRRPINKKSASHTTLEKQVKKFDLCGLKDWDLPEVDELQLLIDRTRYSPAIDVGFFDIPSDWFWTKTAAAWSSGAAWVVHFDYGYVDYDPRDANGFALAVRRVGQ